MTNYNQNYSQSSVFQPGFAGTDPQQVRQQVQSAGQNQYVGSTSNPFTQTGPAQFTGTQGIFQPGFAGTDPQQVRQQVQNVGQNQYAGGSVYQQQQSQPQQQQYLTNVAGSNQGQFTNPNAIFQQGFAGTNTQQVRQNNNQSNQNATSGVYQPQQQQQQYQPVNVVSGQYSGSQAIFQQGFAGTDAQQVRQNNAQSSQQQPFGSQNSFQNQGANQYSGPQAVFQTGFANTNPQQVRQDIANESNYRNQNQYGGYQQ